MVENFTIKKGRGQVHLFRCANEFFALDVNSDTLIEISAEVYEILKKINQTGELSFFEIPQENQDDFNKIITLYQEEALFSSPLEYSAEYSPHLQGMCLFIDGRCNLACSYCFVKNKTTTEYLSAMNFYKTRIAIDFLFQNSPYEEMEVDFFGGEPLLNFPVLQNTVNYGNKRALEEGRKINFTLTTNAILLTPLVQEFLIDNHIEAVLSLDGSQDTNDLYRVNPQGKGSYNTVSHNIKEYISKNPPPFYIRGTYTSQTLHFADSTRYLFNEGFPVVSMEPVVGKKHSFTLKEDDLPEIFQQYELLSQWYLEEKLKGKEITFFHFLLDPLRGPDLKRRIGGCGAGREYIAISPKGDIYPCHQFIGENSFILGNLSEGIKNLDLRDRFISLDFSTKDKCLQCWARFYCSGGCHANHYFANGSIYQPDDLECSLLKKRLEWALWIKAKLKQSE